MQIKELAIIDGRPVVVRVIEWESSNVTPEFKTLYDPHADLLAESKRLNDQFNGR